MNVKRYIADTEAEAFDRIREELGRDAFILNKRKIRRKGLRGVFGKPLVEVVAAYEAVHRPKPEPLPPRIPVREEPPVPREEPILPPPVEAPPIAKPNPLRQPAVYEAKFDALFPPASEPAKGSVQNLSDKIDAINSTLNNLMGKISLNKTDYRSSYLPEIEALTLTLLENELHEEFTHKISREVNEIVLKQNEPAAEVMETILKQYLGEAAPIRLKRFKRTVVLLVGPTGVGKTTTLAKLAAIYAINHHAKVGVVTTDTYRIGAVEQLKTYSEILQTPLSVAYSADDVPDCLREHEDKDIVFIDTAGRSPSGADLESDLTELIRKSEADEVHLALSATTGFTGMLHIVNTFHFLREYKILFTKLDETPTWGSLLNARFLTDRPISYTALGQGVPDDIEVMNSGKIIGRLMGADAL